MGYSWLIVNPAKREYIDPDKFGGGIKLSGRHCVLALTRLISDRALHGGAIDGRWVGDPVILAGGMGDEPPSLYDRAKAEHFTDISGLSLADLCDDADVRRELLDLAAAAGKPRGPGSQYVPEEFFVHLCNALMQHRPELMREKDFTSRLGTDWRKRYEEAYRRLAREHPHGLLD